MPIKKMPKTSGAHSGGGDQPRRRAEEILESTTLFGEALDDLNFEARMNLEENERIHAEACIEVFSQKSNAKAKVK